MRMLRVSMCAMKRSDIECSSWSRRSIRPLLTSRMMLGVMAVALPMRTRCPARHPSPKKSPGPSIATTASLPLVDSTDSFTPPAWMYMTSLQASPCAKITSPRPYLVLERGPPTASRNACALKGGGDVVAAMASFLSAIPAA